MADFVGGAASSLLAVIRSEAQLLGRVRHDVQFIQEEMESMNTFLEHLPRRVPGSGEHDEQIRTWMNQVRRLAQESNNCIDVYLYRCNPEIHRARSSLRRYVLWIPWFAQKMVAQHRAAIQLSVLKDRVRDIGERRLRYGVKVPAKGSAAGQSHAGLSVQTAAASAAFKEGQEDSEDELAVEMAVRDDYGQRGALFGHRTPEENVRLKLADWIKLAAQRNITRDKSVPSVAIVAPDKKETRVVADEALALGGKNGMRCVLVDIPAVHFFQYFLRPQDILYYILRELQSAKSQPQQQQGQMEGEEVQDTLEDSKKTILSEKLKLDGEIKKNIQGMKVDENFSELKKTIEQMKYGKLQFNLRESAKAEPLDVLLSALCLLKPDQPDEGVLATKQGQQMKEATRSHDDVIKETAKLLKEHMEKEAHSKLICLKVAHYEHILREVFPMTTRKPLPIPEQDVVQATAVTREEIKEMMRKALQELQEENSVKKLDAGDDGLPDALIKETMMKMVEIQSSIKEHLKIKAIMDKIIDCLETQVDHHQILVILKFDEDYVSGWEQTRNAFGLLGCIGGALILTTTVNNQRAKEYCYPSREPMDYSLLCLYRDTLVDHTEQHMNKGRIQICLDILDKCKAHEFCMKMFVHSLYANPKRSSEELRKLYRALQEVSEKSFRSIAKKMFKFSYSDLPKEYRSCLLYLAIFPAEQSIRRSTLIGRWAVEGLLNKDDWDSSVRHANRCLHDLVDRWLVYPVDIGATGQVKSCEIGHLVHGFITKIARKQHIVETQLSHKLARHFSIFNNIRLRASDGIDRFIHKLHSQSGRVYLIKVLDLEGCQCFGWNQGRHLKAICNKMLLLKYLGLRGTDVTHLPSEINYLLELEVLDIRQTHVYESSTLKLLLLKMKRLLAGQVVPGPGSRELSSVKLPEKIGNMINLEVLSNVKAQNSHNFKEIGRLWQLRKLGVVIEDKEIDIRNLLRVISDLRDCLRSLSITLPVTDEGPSNEDFASESVKWIIRHNHTKLLESLTMRGTTQKGQLLCLLAKHSDLPRLAKVTLTRTWLKQAALKVLAKLPMLTCMRLGDRAYIDYDLTFNKEEFEHLKSFLVEGSNMIVVSFGDGAAPSLEKIILCSTDSINSLVGVENLPELKEVELKNSNKISLFVNAKKISKVTLSGTILREDDVNILAKMPNMHSLVLKDKSYVEGLIFNKDEFPRLNLLIVDFCITTKISFTGGSAPKLEKIVWSFNKDTVSSICGIENLPNLKDIQLTGDHVPEEVQEAVMKHKNKPTLVLNKSTY